jgi:hypothetical protein
MADDGLLESVDRPASVRIIAIDLLAGIAPRHQVKDDANWRRKLSRRRRAGAVTWAQFRRLEQRYSLPRARMVHPPKADGAA